jgi:hypothetical protein
MPTETPTPDVFDDSAFPLALEQRRAHLLAMPDDSTPAPFTPPRTAPRGGSSFFVTA